MEMGVASGRDPKPRGNFASLANAILVNNAGRNHLYFSFHCILVGENLW